MTLFEPCENGVTTLTALGLANIDRLLSKISVTTEDGCWEWTHAVDGRGYGAIRVAGKNLKPHRLVAMLCISGALLPPDIEVCHRCDNTKCCNPKHLFMGTHTDNMRDMFSKSRRKSAVGEKSGQSKLTQQQVHSIRALAKENTHSKREIARMFGVSHTNVNHIVKGKIWNT